MQKTIYVATLALALATALEAQAAGSGSALVCGGVGTDERRELAAAAGGANMTLEFSLAGRGNYVADVDVTLTRAATGAAFTVKTDGPICYLQLPPGRYQVEASYNGARKSATANIATGAGKAVRVAMTFPATAADIDPAPVSAEEKLQASKP
jgi:hypothetical protein